MPRAGLSRPDVIAAAAVLADEVGLADLTMGLLARRLGIRTPSLYKHVTDLADLRHGIAIAAMNEVGEEVRDVLQGRSGRDALTALLTTIRSYATAHPGRYAAANGTRATGPDDPLIAGGARVVASIAAALRGYGIPDAEMVHAIRTIRSTIHGFALLQQTEGFQLTENPDDTFNWMVEFIDRGLRAAAPHPAS
jgi:AcrR family transcriptional regulator